MIKILWCVALLFSSSAFSQNAFDSKAGWAYYSDGLGGTRIISGSRVIGAIPAPVTPYVGALPSVNGTSVSTLASGELSLAAKTSASIGGKLAPMDVVAKVAKRDVAVALGKFASKVYAPLVVGVALYDLAKDLGFTLNNSSGSLVVTKERSVIDLVCNPSAHYPICQESLKDHLDRSPSCAIELIEQTCYSVMYLKNPSYRMGMDGWSALTTYSKQEIPSNLQELEDAIVDKSSWPSNSKLGPAFVDAIKSGVVAPTGTPVLTGPTTVPGTPTVTTTNNPNSSGSSTGPGSSTTTTTNTPTTNITYQGDKYTTNVTNNTTSTTETVNNDNSVTSSTSTTTQENPDKPDDGTISDTPLSEIPELYTPKYPNGLTGVWDDKSAAIKALPLFNAAANLMPNVAAGGTCPHWPINLNLGPNMNYGSHDVAPPCWIWDFGKFVIVVSSLLLARRLVFGG